LACQKCGGHLVSKQAQGRRTILVCASCGHPLPPSAPDSPGQPHWSWGLLLLGLALLGGVLLFLGGVSEEEPRSPARHLSERSKSSQSGVVNRSMRSLGLKLPDQPPERDARHQ